MSDDLLGMRRVFGDATTCRVATVRADGGPHVAARWFVWIDEAVWVSTRVGDTTWEHALRDPRLCVLIDRGRTWSELAGVRIDGVAEAFPAEHPDLRAPMSAWHEKYRQHFTGDAFEAFTTAVPALGFLRIVPARVESWDHR